MAETPDWISSGHFARIVRRDPSTVWRWFQRYPGLAIKVGGRHDGYRPAAEAIASGIPLDQAAALAPR